MALIKCPECNKEVSDTAKNCIHCGYVLKEEKDITQSQTVVIAHEKGKSGKNNLNKGVMIFITLSITAILSYLMNRMVNYDYISMYEDLVYRLSSFFAVFSTIQSIAILFVPKMRKKWFLVIYLIINLFILPLYVNIEQLFILSSMSTILLLAALVAHLIGYIFVIKSMINKE